MSALVCFQVAEQSFALDVHSVREVQRRVTIQAVVGLPAAIPGVVNVHGQTVPVLDLRVRLAMIDAPAPTDTPEAALLIVYSRGQLLIIPVDRVEGVWQVTDVPQAGSGWECARGIVQIDGRLVTVLDADALPIPELEPLLAAQA